jgi:hypothetical protein
MLLLWTNFLPYGIPATDRNQQKSFNRCGCDLITPCTLRWNSVYDRVKKVLEKCEYLQKMMSALNLPCFKDVELDLLDEYVQTLAITAVALNRLHGYKMC